MMLLRKAAFAALIAAACSPAGAETVFTRDGAIHSGSIIEDQELSITLRKEDGGTENILRADIMRTLFTDIYMGRVFVRLTAGDLLTVYQVDEDKDTYTFRRELTKPEEITIPRKKVMFIARTNPTDLRADPEPRELRLEWNPPYKPAHSYRIYLRDASAEQDSPFVNSGISRTTSFAVRDLTPGRRYEIYVTAVDQSGEESLPSDKIEAKTLPDAPSLLTAEKRKNAGDGKKSLLLRWEKSKTGSVRTYAVYSLDGREPERIGDAGNCEFSVPEHHSAKRKFAVRSVDGDGTESRDAQLSLGLPFCLALSGNASYIIPAGNLARISDSGYGADLSAAAAGSIFRIGAGTGIIRLLPSKPKYDPLLLFPLTAEFSAVLPFSEAFSFEASAGAGCVFLSGSSAGTKISGTDLITHCTAQLRWTAAERTVITGGLRFAWIREKGGDSGLVSLTCGAAAEF